jgi:hypothetical protein
MRSPWNRRRRPRGSSSVWSDVLLALLVFLIACWCGYVIQRSMQAPMHDPYEAVR